MEDAGLEFLDLDAELQANLPKDGEDYLKQFGGLQAPDFDSALTGTYYEGVPLDENPEAIFDVLSRESRLRFRPHSSGKESRTGSALITAVTSSEDPDTSLKAPDTSRSAVRVIGRAERRHPSHKRVSFNESQEKEKEEWELRGKVLDKKSRFFPQRNEKASEKNKTVHTAERDPEKSPKKAKGLKFSGFSKLLHKRNDEKATHSTPRNAVTIRPLPRTDSDFSDLRTIDDTSQVYNTIGDLEIDENTTVDLDPKDYSFEDITDIEFCYGASHIQDGASGTSSSRQTVSGVSPSTSEDHSVSSALYTNISVPPSSHTLLSLQSEIPDVVEILSTEPSQDDVISNKRHLAINSNILKLQEPLPSAALGNVEKLRMFVNSLSRDTIMRTADDQGQTTLHLAVLNGHLHCVVLLCSKFPEMLQGESKEKLTPSSLAIKNGKIEILDWLIEHTSVSKEFSSTKQRRSLVHQAAKFGQDGCLRLLLDKLQSKGAIKEPLDSSGNTPAHLAAKYGHLTCLQTLVEYGRDVCLANESELTPFQYAFTTNHRHCAAYLVTVHGNRQMARKLAVNNVFMKKYEEDRRMLRTKLRELLSMTGSSKLSQSQKDHHGNLPEILDHVVTQVEDLYIENSALRQRFNGAKKGSFVLRDDVKAMLSKLKMLREDLDGKPEVGKDLTSAKWHRLEELQRYTDDVTKVLPPSATVDRIAWEIQRESFNKVYLEMMNPQSKESHSKNGQETLEDVYKDPGDIELYETNESLTNGESYGRSKRRRRTRTSHAKVTDPMNDPEDNGRTVARGHNLMSRSDGHLGDDSSSTTYDELPHTTTYAIYSGGLTKDIPSPPNLSASHYVGQRLPSTDANIIEVLEPASETSIDLPNGSSDEAQDDIDAMDSVSQAGDEYRDRTLSQYTWHHPVTITPNRVAADSISSALVDHNDSGGVKNKPSIVDEGPLSSSLLYSSLTKHTKDMTFSKDESRKKGSGDIPNDGFQTAVTCSYISGAKAERVFEQSENMPAKEENSRGELCRTEENSQAAEGERVGFTAVLCGTDKEHISKDHEMLAAEETLPPRPLSGHPSLGSSLDLGDKRSSLLRDIEQDSEDILMALGASLPDDVELTLPSDGGLRILPSMQFEMRLATIEEASMISGSLPCDDDDEEEEENLDDEADDEEGTADGHIPMAANEFSGDEKPWYENSDEDDVTTWRPRRHEQHGHEEHLTLL